MILSRCWIIIVVVAVVIVVVVMIMTIGFAHLILMSKLSVHDMPILPTTPVDPAHSLSSS